MLERLKSLRENELDLGKLTKFVGWQGCSKINSFEKSSKQVLNFKNAHKMQTNRKQKKIVRFIAEMSCLR